MLTGEGEPVLLLVWGNMCIVLSFVLEGEGQLVWADFQTTQESIARELMTAQSRFTAMAGDGARNR